MARGEASLSYYRDTDSLLLKVKTENLLENCDTSEHISPSMDYTNWDESIYSELVLHQAAKKPLYLKFTMRIGLISHSVLTGQKLYCRQTKNKEIKMSARGCLHTKHQTPYISSETSLQWIQLNYQ